MTTNVQRIKFFIKASIIVFVLSVFVVLGIFIRPTRTFENAHMGKWLSLNNNQKVSTIQNVAKDVSDMGLLIKCVDKIAQLPHSNEMQIQYAIVFCNKATIQNEE